MIHTTGEETRSWSMLPQCVILILADRFDARSPRLASVDHHISMPYGSIRFQILFLLLVFCCRRKEEGGGVVSNRDLTSAVTQQPLYGQTLQLRSRLQL